MFWNRKPPQTEQRAGWPGGPGSIGNASTSWLLGGAGPTASGVSVSPQTAMQCATVRACVQVLAESVAQLPLHLYQRGPGGGGARVVDHPVEQLIGDAANPWTSATQFRLLMETSRGLYGNCFAYVSRDHEGKPVELIPLRADCVVVTPDRNTSEPVYTYTGPAGERSVYSYQDILHVRGIGTSLYYGDSPVTLAREAIALAMVMEKYAASLFGSGARPSGLLKVNRQVTEVTMARLRGGFENMFRGSGNAGKTAILEEGMDFLPLQLSSVDTQFLEMRKFAILEIARFWRIPPHLLQDLERVTFSNAESLGSQFISFTLLPILKLWAGSIQMTLLTAEDRAAGLYVAFDVDEIARADVTNRFTAFSQAINAGVMSPNEVRILENLPPYKGGEIFTRPINTAAVTDGPVLPTSAGPVQPGANLVH